MKLSVRIGLVVVALIAVVVVIILGRPEREPEYKGKRLSEWLVKMVSTYPRYEPEAVEALRGMGEPAIRWLGETVEREDSTLTKKLREFTDMVPMLQGIIPGKSWNRFIAAKVLGEIGTNAVSTVPALQKMARDSDSNLARIATAALVLVQGESIEKIVSDYFDYKGTDSSKAFGMLMELGPHAKIAIPKLIEELNSTNDHARLNASIVLGYVGIESPECIPVFTHLLSNTNELIRMQAIHGLTNCGELAKSTAPSVVALLDDPESLCRSSALIYLLQVVPSGEFAPFSAAVQRATNDIDQTVRGLAETVLQEKTTAR